jgi:hypothetical protein
VTLCSVKLQRHIARASVAVAAQCASQACLRRIAAAGGEHGQHVHVLKSCKLVAEMTV